ncbi:phosphoribosyl-AMP cyclohydrolase [Alloyangia pacifica]|uniref:phosphoribosyl-AMP cyclohydrolase n=1 Tax=Alloyangia pacifica TaxID=311180 RepID=UPI001CD33261|nr:phosphoribosyl-AMP cyclohydrolase [Alloyangia pacifica]MCA0997262.1 phosphoribosyl-AMP cyclohydrolase [Alloyangia pacifica]
MMGVMSPEALSRSIETAEAHYWSRSRQCLWHKGATSALVQRIGSDLADAAAGPGHRAHRAADHALFIVNDSN